MTTNNFVIDPSSVSREQIEADLKAFLESAPDAAKWRDFFASSTGTTVQQLIAGLGSFLYYNNIVARRESFLLYALNRSSVIAGASNLGYSVHRGQNPRLSLTVVPVTTGVLSKFSSIGSYKDLDLILAEDTVVNAGVPVNLNVIPGLLKEEQYTIATDGPGLFRFNSNRVSEDTRLYLGAAEVPTSRLLLDLRDGKFVLMSNVNGSVDVIYLNLDTFAYRYVGGSVLTLQWIEYRAIDVDLSKVVLDSGTLTGTSITSTNVLPETIDNIRINAPLFNETQFVIRGRDDYLKIFKQSDNSLVSVSGEDVSPAIIRLYGIRSDLSLFSPSEKQTIVNRLSRYRPFGMLPPLIGDPEPQFIGLKATLKLKPGQAGNPTQDVEAIFAAHEHVLQDSLSFVDLENEIERLSYVNTARVGFITTPWTALTVFSAGTRVAPSTPNTFLYSLNRLVYRSGGTEPEWPITEGATIEDGRVIWTGSPRTGVRPTWAPSRDTLLGDLVTPTGLIGTPPTSASASYMGATFTAASPGQAGNSIGLQFDNVTDIDTLIQAWNAGHPSNQVEFTGLPGNTVLPASLIELSGGADFQPVDFQFEATGFINRGSSDSPAVASSNTFNGLLKAYGTHDGVLFTAVTAGIGGNSISLSFNGVNTVQEFVDAWNTANPGNQVAFNPPSSGSSILIPGSLTLSNGAVKARAEFRGVEFVADQEGTSGNSINLSFDGVLTLQQVVAAWNSANPSNSVSFTGGSGDVIWATRNIALSGGSNTATLVVTADTPGNAGNFINLILDGTVTIEEAIQTWNTANPTNTCSLAPAELGATIPDSVGMALGGGSNMISGEPSWPTTGC